MASRILTFVFLFLCCLSEACKGEEASKSNITQKSGLEMCCYLSHKNIEVGKPVEAIITLENIGKQKLVLPRLPYGISERSNKGFTFQVVRDKTTVKLSTFIKTPIIFYNRIVYSKPFMTKKEYFFNTGQGYKFRYYNESDLVTMNEGEKITYKVIFKPLLIGDATLVSKFKVFTEKYIKRSVKDGSCKEAVIPQLWQGNFICTEANIRITQPNQETYQRNQDELIENIKKSEGDSNAMLNYINKLGNSQLSSQILIMHFKENRINPKLDAILLDKLMLLAEKGIAYNQFCSLMMFALSEKEVVLFRKAGIEIAFIILANKREMGSFDDMKSIPYSSIDINFCGNYGTIGITQEIYNLAEKVMRTCEKSTNGIIREFAISTRRKLNKK